MFFDRDGTLNEAVGYVNHASRFKLYPWAVDAVRLAGEEGYLAVLTTNQSAVGRGYITEELLSSIHSGLSETLEVAGAKLDGIYHCPHLPSESCACRKPKPGMLVRAAEELDIDLASSWMIGDNFSDLQAGWAAGTRAAMVKTGSGEGALEQESARWDKQPDLIADNVHQAVCDICWGPR